MAERHTTQQIIGEAPAFLAMLEHVSRAAPLDRSVLVVGERGTGKELIASRLHFLSERWEQNVVKVNCAALTETILESELFGHEAGAFTGAQKTHVGHFERADGGTLILDELATITLRMQEKILRVIEYGEIQRVGGSDTLRVDVRVVGSTNADLQAMAAEGKFRRDLLDRLAFDVITVPPLRERVEDIMGEIQRQMRSLKRQASKARRSSSGIGSSRWKRWCNTATPMGKLWAQTTSCWLAMMNSTLPPPMSMISLFC